MYFSRWGWCCLFPLCTRRRLWTCSHLPSALPTTTCTSCIWSPWRTCCRSCCPPQVETMKLLSYTLIWKHNRYQVCWLWNSKHGYVWIWTLVTFLLRFPICCRRRGDGGGESGSRAVQHCVTTHWEVQLFQLDNTLHVNEAWYLFDLVFRRPPLNKVDCLAFQTDPRCVQQFCSRESEEGNRTFPSLCCSLLQLPDRSPSSRGTL